MKLKTLLFILLGLIYNGQFAYADSDLDVELDDFFSRLQYPKYKNIAHPPLNVEYKGHKGTAMFITHSAYNDTRSNLEVYFLTNNNQELNKVLEFYPYQYRHSEIISAFEFTDKGSGHKFIYILLKNDGMYRFIELPLRIEEDGVLRALFFVKDNAVISKITCMGEDCEISTKDKLIEYLNKRK